MRCASNFFADKFTMIPLLQGVLLRVETRQEARELLEEISPFQLVPLGHAHVRRCRRGIRKVRVPRPRGGFGFATPPLTCSIFLFQCAARA